MTPFYNKELRPFLRELCDDKIDSGITKEFKLHTLADDKIDKFLSIMMDYKEETFFRILDWSEIEQKLKIMLLTQESVDKLIFADFIKEEVFKLYEDQMQDLLTQEFDAMVMEYEADKALHYAD